MSKAFALVFLSLVPVTLISAWITHWVVTIQAQEWLFLIAGALIFPVACAHGVSVWFGFNWLV